MPYVVNLQKVLDYKNLPSWLYKCAFELQVAEYLPAGEYFEKLDDEELLDLKTCAEKVQTEDFVNFEVHDNEAEKNLENLSLLCFLLALGEGIVEVNPEELSTMLQSLFMLTAIENLGRQRLVKVIRANYSIIDGSKPVVKAKQ